MSKPIIGLFLGCVLGVFDGLSALLSAGGDPAVRADIGLIVMMGVFKGMVSGLAIGFFARRFESLPLGIFFGLCLGLLLALPIALMQGQYYWQIMGPGALLGMIIGFATQRYGLTGRRGSGEESGPRRVVG